MDLMTVIAGVAAGNALTAMFVYWCIRVYRAERDGRDPIDEGVLVHLIGATPFLVVLLCLYGIKA